MCIIISHDTDPEQQASPIYDNTGNLVAIEGIVRDITERKRIEQEMVRLDQLRLIGEMAATIAHEIRNPMATVHGYLQVFRSKNELIQYNEYLAIMIDELDRANSIINDYLYLGKESKPNLLSHKLNKVIKTLFPLIEACAKGSSKSIKLELGDIPDLALDEKKIRQLLLNLAQNGLDSMPTGGVLNIRTYMDNDKVVLEVRDQGKGIEPEALENLGKPFFTTKEEGTGLGLAVCFNIAARHKATITVDTGPEGTTFCVRF